MEQNSTSSEQLQKFLDENQYTVNGILRYEKVFGEGFISTGGLETTEVSLSQKMNEKYSTMLTSMLTSMLTCLTVMLS